MQPEETELGATTPEELTFAGIREESMNPLEEEEPTTAPEPEETEETDDEETLGEADLLPKDADQGAEEEEADTETYQLDPQVLDKIEDPEAKAYVEKRWKEQVAGLTKKERQAEETLASNAALLEFAAMFDNPETVEEALEHLLTNLEATHKRSFKPAAPTVRSEVAKGGEVDGIPLAPGMKELQERDDNGHYLPKYEQYGYATEAEFHQAAEIAALRREMAEIKGEITPIREERKTHAELVELEKRIERELPKVQARFNREFNGFGRKISQDTIKAAIKVMPQYKDDLFTAVKKAFDDQLREHVSGQVAERTKRGPELIQASKGKGKQLVKDPSELTIADIRREMALNG